MAVLTRHTRSLATVGLLLATAVPLCAQQRLGLQGSGGGASGAPLDLLSPSFIAPAPRLAVPQTGSAGTVPSGAMAVPVIHAPLPLPRPLAAPRAVITEASAPPPALAGIAATQPGPAPQAVVEAPASPPPTSSADDYPDDDRRDQVIIPGAFVRRQSGAEAIAAVTAQPAPQQPALPERTIAFAAPVPPARPGELRGTVAPSPAPAAGPTLASASSTPVVLSSSGTATTMVIPSGAAGAPVGMAPQPLMTTPRAPTGPVLAALPPQGGTADWPRYVPGAAAVERNLGIAGERVMPDPGVSLACLPAPVRRALNDVALRFGPILVRSTFRGDGRFVRMDEYRGSYHRDCRAADFRVSGNGGAVIAYLRQRPELGGVKRYRNGLIHIDNGPRRSW
jgi:hypothetical protein